MSGSAPPGESSSASRDGTSASETGQSGGSRAAEPPDRHWFEALADHLGPAYLRYSFTKGTEQEVAFLVEALALGVGAVVLDVGCGPGRHAYGLARAGHRVVGVDISQAFVALASVGAPPGASFVRGDARRLPVRPRFDAVISLCQGGFGLPFEPAAPDDGSVLRAMAAALRPGGRLALTAFSSYFLVRHLEDTDDFDPDVGVNRERTTVKDADGRDATFDLWTACYTPRELRALASDAGLRVLGLWSVTPGDYARRPPDLEHPELLLLAEHRGPGGAREGSV